MKKIGITQRVELITGYNEERDCLDQRWGVMLEQLGFLPIPIPNRLINIADWAEDVELNGLIFSGGNDLCHLPNANRPSSERDKTEYALLDYASSKFIPVLGICRGLQIMNVHLGGSLIPVNNHVSCKHRVASLETDSPFSAYTEVNSYHGWGISANTLGDRLLPGLQCADGTIEAIIHEVLPWIGIMWHPEREQPFNILDEKLITTLFRN